MASVYATNEFKKNVKLEIDGIRRLVREVDLNIHDTKVLASLSAGDEREGLFYHVVGGGNLPENVLEIEKDIYAVEILSEAELKRRGLSPRPDTPNSFHVKDPDGYDLQISGKGMTPD